MTPMPPAGIGGGAEGNPQRPRSLVLWLTGVIMLAVVAAQTFVFVDTGRADREGVKDNLLWILSQVIVEVQFAEAQVLGALATDEPITRYQQNQIRISADIALSRIQIALAAYRTFYGPESVAPGLVSIQSALEETIGIIEADPDLAPASLLALQERFKELVRVSYAEVTGHLHRLLSYEQQSREERVRLIGYAMIGVWVLAALLLLAVFQGLRANRLFADEERKTALAALRLQRAFDASPYAVYVLDHQLNVISRNSRSDIFHRCADCDGDRVPNLIEYFGPGDDRAMVSAAVQSEVQGPGQGQALDASPALAFRTDMAAQSGASIPVEVILARLSGRGRDAEFVAFIRDRSADVAAERDLRSARDRAVADAGIKERFLALIGHELRTPLQGVLAAVELFDPEDSTDQREFLRMSAKQCAQSALAQIDNVLLHARSGRLNEAEEPFSPTDIIESIVQEFSALAAENENDLTLQIEPDGADILVLGSATSFNLAVRNLVANAIKYTRNGAVSARLSFTVLGPDVEVAFSVADTGIGIAEDQLPRLFDEYMRVGGEGEQHPSGFGLGLPIAKASVERLGGRIHVESTPGRGSLFAFSFRAPIQAPTAAPAPEVVPDAKRPVSTIGKRILLVEDNVVNQALLLAMLERLGHTGVAALSGEEALALARDQVFDHVFMDLGLPGMDGLAAAKEVKQSGRNRSCPITILTARDPGEVEYQARQVGITEIIRKPVDMERLRQVLDRQSSKEGPLLAAAPLLSPDFDRTVQLVGRPAMRELAAAALDESSTALDALRAWLDSDAPPDGIIRTVHKAVGSAGVIGAARLAQEWQDVEAALRAGAEIPAATVERILCSLIETRHAFTDTLMEAAPGG